MQRPVDWTRPVEYVTASGVYAARVLCTDGRVDTESVRAWAGRGGRIVLCVVVALVHSWMEAPDGPEQLRYFDQIDGTEIGNPARCLRNVHVRREGWINLYVEHAVDSRTRRGGQIHDSKEQAQQAADRDVVTTVPIAWTEPTKQEKKTS